MKKFRFRLEPLLRLREQREDQKKRVVAQYQLRINEMQRQALEMAERIKEEGEYLRDQHRRGTVDLHWLRHYYSFVTHTQRAIARRIDEVLGLQKELTTARQELMEATRQKKVLEKLKEKQKLRYLKHLEKREVHRLDEIGTSAFLRARTEVGGQAGADGDLHTD